MKIKIRDCQIVRTSIQFQKRCSEEKGNISAQIKSGDGFDPTIEARVPDKKGA
jgi:hypothetical protein